MEDAKIPGLNQYCNHRLYTV